MPTNPVARYAEYFNVSSFDSKRTTAKARCGSYQGADIYVYLQLFTLTEKRTISKREALRDIGANRSYEMVVSRVLVSHCIGLWCCPGDILHDDQDLCAV
jgi:hypothetical protein